MNCCGVAACSGGIGDGWGGNCGAAGEKGCGEVVDTLWGTLPGRIWFAIMGDGVAFVEPLGCKCGYGDGWPVCVGCMPGC